MVREAGDPHTKWHRVREAVDVDLSKAALRIATEAGNTELGRRLIEKQRETWGLSPAQIARSQRAEQLVAGTKKPDDGRAAEAEQAARAAEAEQVLAEIAQAEGGGG